MLDYVFETFAIILTSMMGYVVYLLKTNRGQKDKESIKIEEQQEAIQEALKCLLRVKLIEYHDDYMEVGSIPSYALQNFIEMYDAYHVLGGNGMITQMISEIKKLPIKKQQKVED